jgi:serine protease Do
MIARGARWLVTALLLAPACTPSILPTAPPSPETSPPGTPLRAPGAAPETIADVVEQVMPAVVSVTTNLATPESLTGEGRSAGTGTGFLLREDGVVVTNFHVVEGALNIRVVTSDGRRFNARAIGGDPEADLAVLKIDPRADLPVVPLGTSDRLRLGEQVLALGFALGLEGGPSVTSGIVSAIERTLTAADPNTPEGQRTYEDLIQTDAAINPGNSGGPLVNLAGEVVGINTAGIQASAAENIGFAIAIDRARPVIDRAMDDPDKPVAYLGVSTQDVDSALAFQLDLPVDEGALVVDVAPGGPADDAGIDPGDVIVRIEDQDVRTSEEVRDAIIDREPGEELEVMVVRANGSRERVTATLTVRPLPVGRG